MNRAILLLSLSVLSALSSLAARAQSASITTRAGSETVTITEPAIFKLEQMYKMADVVAIIRVVAGDAENYKVDIYKAVVVQAFKGTAVGKTLYFGQYSGGRLGWEYIAFLRNAKEPAVPKIDPAAAYGKVSYLEDFDQGYTAMETSYQCGFDGKSVEEMCDYAVRVCTDYIVLPKNTPTAPPLKKATDFGCRYVRKEKFISLLDKLAERPGVLQMPASAVK
jgi:hypothetical protein